MTLRILDLPLKVKLVAVSALGVVGLAAALLVELPRAMEAQSKDWLLSRSMGMGRLLGHALEAAVDFDDAAAAGDLLAGLRDGRGISYAIVRRPDGSVLSAWNAGAVAPALPPGTGEAAEVSGGLLRVRIPLVTRSGRSAALLMGFGLEELEERGREARRAVAAIAAVFLVGGLATSFLLAQVISRPLSQITEVARRVAEGEEQGPFELPTGRRDETGVLAVAFRHMLAQLSAQRGDLARLLRERTLELSRTNHALEELERTQQQLVLADRRISIGRLAAGVAHEINNPLAFLSGNLDYVANQLPPLAALVSKGDAAPAREVVARVAEAVAESQQGAYRVARIVRGLRTFARDDEDRRDRVRLELPLTAAIDMAMNEIKHRARLVRSFGPVPEVVANEVQLSQVFLNLLVNAAHAIPEGGSDEHEIRVSLGRGPSGRALVEVADTGSGIPPEVQARIFDPFFTTKPVGVGTGLGLSISRNIVEKFGGEITFESEVGAGSVFRVSLPAASDEHRSCPAAGEAVGPALPPELTLLVVDDEPLVGAAVRRALGAEIRVVVAEGGRSALEWIRTGARIDRILCDLMMPDLSGADLYAEVLRERPGLERAFIFMTGGAFTERAQAFQQRHPGACLEKPLDFHQLRRLLHGDAP